MALPTAEPITADQPRLLYRGLTLPYDANHASRCGDGTDFTDCPYTALLYAKGPKGVVLVVD
ncbi:MAG: hypothetical protein JW751_10885, partial [Polyangiaceae bacterium]|nr:hypothetical protein [Polyangiaceae bacterium]